MVEKKNEDYVAELNLLSANQLNRGELPIIDLTSWFKGDLDAQRQIADSMNRLFKQVGFVYLSNQGIPQDLTDSVFQVTESFFNLPEEKKQQVHYNRANFRKGYIPILVESADPSAKGDFREVYDMGLGEPFPNLWPADLPCFREILEDYSEKLLALANTIFEIFALSFNLPYDYFKSKTNKPMATFRLVNYPSMDAILEPNMLGIGTHCDCEFFTIITQNSVEGLEVKTRVDEWVKVPNIPGTVVVILGEMMARWTNNWFLPTPHRVINTSGFNRYSAVFFFAPNFDTVISCLDCCVDQDNPLDFQPFTAGDFKAERIQKVYGHRV